jgi:DNA (cytosine-5)-methyltransferase 1
MRAVNAVDLFCGAGGTSTGIEAAARRIGRELRLVAINHWATAISTHSMNHPTARNVCWPVEQIQPKRVVSGGRLNLLAASPECTHHSIARGGMPVNDQRRAGAWEVCRWATELRIDSIMVENVREFEQWGPIGQDGRPLKSRNGETFRAWVKALESLNYRVEWRVLNCADYGDPTSRKRLFVLARRGRGRIEWPQPTHGSGRKPWHTAREIIDWSLSGRSIFDRERPLSPRTIDRIAAGLRKFGGPAAEPFLVMLYGTGGARSVARPMPTVTANGQHVGLCEPFLFSYYGNGGESRVTAPVPTVTTLDRFGLVQPRALDILFRMLTPVELAAAQGFPRDYRFAGTTCDVVRQIGNAVPTNTAAALAESMLAA